VVLVAGAPPIRATKIRYYADPRLAGRVCALDSAAGVPNASKTVDWSDVGSAVSETKPATSGGQDEGGLKREPDLDGPEAPPPSNPEHDLDLVDDQEGDDAQQGRELQRRFTGAARQAALDRDDGIPLGDDA
jgi:type IV secretion system protein VirD4